jgi:methyl-accepting chemotaxis protein
MGESRHERTSLSALLDPRMPARLALRALDDLHALASVARREPHPVDALREELREAVAEIRELNRRAARVADRAREVVDGGAGLTDAAERIDERLEHMEPMLRSLDRITPTLTRGLGAIDSLEDSVETVGPLQGAAEGVGKVARRLRRGDGGDS